MLAPVPWGAPLKSVGHAGFKALKPLTNVGVKSTNLSTCVYFTCVRKIHTLILLLLFLFNPRI